MGNSFSIPESMKGLPDYLNQNQYIEITSETGEKFYVHRRSIGGIISGQFRQNFSRRNIGYDMLGLGRLNEINNALNQQTRSYYYITKTPEPNENNALQSGIDNNNLKGYIKLFFADINFVNKFKIDLEKSTFELKESTKPLSFGKKRINLNEKRLKQDLRLLKSF